MNNDYQQALATMSIEDVGFILSQLSPPAPSVASSNDVVAQITQSDDDEENRRRRHIDRQWPPVGTELTAEYFGVSYGAEIITAAKKLKSGKQIRITSGAAKGMICDSFSEAMLTATEDQRNKENLGRKGTSNGWVFWDWPGKPENIAGDDQEEQ